MFNKAVEVDDFYNETLFFTPGFDSII